MTDEKSRFWMVWCEGSPTTHYRHGTKTMAIEECKRLARANSGEVFYILKATRAIRARKAKLDRLPLVADPIPF